MEPKPPQPKEEKGRLLRLVLAPTLTLFLLFSVLFALHHSGLLQGLKDPQSLQQWIQAKGLWAPLIFLGILALRPFTLIPSLLFSPLAFALFGPYLGTLYKVLGETLGASLAFFAARHGFRGSLRHIFAKKGSSSPRLPRFRERFGRMLEQRAFLTVLALRVNLLIPFDAINYGLGLSPIRFVPFAFGTLIGILPGSYLYVAGSGAALQGNLWQTLLLVGGLLFMVLASVPMIRNRDSK